MTTGVGFARRPLAAVFMALAVVAVPFQQAFTVDIGFPLKISEVAVGVAAIAYILSKPEKRSTLLSPVPVTLFFVAFAGSSAMWWVRRDPPGKPPTGYPSFERDLFQYAGYGALVAVALFLAVVVLGHDGIGRCLGMAVRLCAAYCLVELALWIVGSADVLHHVGGVTQIGQSLPVDLPRNGSFLEGNYLGFFAGASAFVCANGGDRRGVWLCAGMVVFSQSTSAIVAVVVAALAAALFRPTGKALTWFAGLGLLLILAAAVSSPVSHYADSQLNKLGVTSSSAAVSSATYSVQGRQTNSLVGLRMGWSSPLIGYGPGRYGVHYNDFLRKGDPLQRFQIRPIANSAYSQLAAEHGLVALAALIGTLGACFSRQVRRSTPLLMMVVFIAVTANAVPAWTVLTMWFALAYLLAEPSVVPAEPELHGSARRRLAQFKALPPVTGRAPQPVVVLSRSRPGGDELS